MCVKGLASWFWMDILKRNEGRRFVQGADSKWRPNREFAIVLRHSKILLKQDGLNEAAIMRTLLAMQAIGKNITALTQVRWESKAGSGTSFYSLATGGAGQAPAYYDTFGQLLAQQYPLA